MALEVIGAGMPRTGTESLKFALEALGYERCYHMVELIEQPAHLPLWESAGRGEPIDFAALFAGYRAAVDFPAMRYWRTLAAFYPDAKIVLTTRAATAWHTSLTNTILSAIEHLPQNDPSTTRRRQMVRRDLVDGLFEGRARDVAHMCQLFERHSAAVVATIAAERLLVFDVRDGWAPLCKFLGQPIPPIDFPRGNATLEFRRKYIEQEP